MKKILSIDGGGVRGIIPLLTLAALEERTGQPTAHLFDLIAGSSTGGNIALGLSMNGPNGQPDNAAHGAVLYEQNCPVIFERPKGFLGSIFTEKYSSKGIRGIMNGYYNQTWLSEAITPVLITAYEIEQRMAYFFRSTEAKKNPAADFLMQDIVVAATAAPTFFEPAQIQNRDTSQIFTFIDGGTFANNPAACAYAEARAMFPEENDFLLLSLGTGERVEPIPYAKAKTWGLAQWARPVLSIVFDGTVSAINQQLWKMLPNMGESDNRYYRMQLELEDTKLASFDNASPAHLATLKEIAQNYINDNQKTLESLAKVLKTER